MKIKKVLKIIVDITMTMLFLVLMAYHVTGNLLHEWLGVILFALFILHHILNTNWYKSLFKGKYTALRLFMTTVNILLFIAMIGMMASGIMLSRNVFGFLNLRAGIFGRRLHMVSTAWGYCLMAAHIGLHWGSVIGMMKKKRTLPEWVNITLRCAAAAAALYGCYAFIYRQLGKRMFLLLEFVFFDYDEPIIFFLADYICILILFAAISYYISQMIKNMKRSVK